jgi:hypothetical protein
MADADRDQKPTASPTSVDATARARKPYVKPALRCDRVFETTALACGKINANQAQCRLNKKVS